MVECVSKETNMGSTVSKMSSSCEARPAELTRCTAGENDRKIAEMRKQYDLDNNVVRIEHEPGMTRQQKMDKEMAQLGAACW